MKEKKVIVISAVNLTEGGTYTILLKCLDAVSKLHADYIIYALVNNSTDLYFPNIKFIEFPKSKKNWLNRIYYEYWVFKKISKQLKPYLLLSSQIIYLIMCVDVLRQRRTFHFLLQKSMIIGHSLMKEN